MLFGIPRNDPRFQQATDEDIVADLLDAMYVEGERRRADPAAQQLEEVLRDPAAARRDDDELATKVGSGTLGERIAAFERARKTVDPGPRVTSVKPAPRKKRPPKARRG